MSLHGPVAADRPVEILSAFFKRRTFQRSCVSAEEAGQLAAREPAHVEVQWFRDTLIISTNASDLALLTGKKFQPKESPELFPE